MSKVSKLTRVDVCALDSPAVYTYKDLMKLTLEQAELTRPIVSLPFALGMVQGAVLERLPENLFTVTRSQVRSYLSLTPLRALLAALSLCSKKGAQLILYRDFVLTR